MGTQHNTQHNNTDGSSDDDPKPLTREQRRDIFASYPVFRKGAWEPSGQADPAEVEPLDMYHESTTKSGAHGGDRRWRMRSDRAL